MPLPLLGTSHFRTWKLHLSLENREQEECDFKPLGNPEAAPGLPEVRRKQLVVSYTADENNFNRLYQWKMF